LKSIPLWVLFFFVKKLGKIDWGDLPLT